MSGNVSVLNVTLNFVVMDLNPMIPQLTVS